MKRNIYFLVTFILCGITQIINAQDLYQGFCGVPSNISVNDLSRQRDIPDGFQDEIFECGYFIKTKIHFINDYDNSNMLIDDHGEQVVVDSMMNLLNTAFNTYNIYFLNQGVEHWADSSLYRFFGNDVIGLTNQIKEHVETSESVIDIFVKDSLFVAGMGNSSNLEEREEDLHLYVGGSQNGRELALSHVLSHEMAHVLGLYHVFNETNYFRVNGVPKIYSELQDISELHPNGENCDITTHGGDGVCDTNPTPEIGHNEINEYGEWIILSETDDTRIKRYQPKKIDDTYPSFNYQIEGEYVVYEPQTENIMGYYGLDIINEFTDGQALKMTTNIRNNYLNEKVFIDGYLVDGQVVEIPFEAGDDIYICSGISTELGFDTANDFEYVWRKIDGTYIGAGSQIEVTPSVTTTYMLTVELDCGTLRDYVTVYVDELESFIQTPETLYYCEGESLNINTNEIDFHEDDTVSFNWTLKNVGFESTLNNFEYIITEPDTLEFMVTSAMCNSSYEQQIVINPVFVSAGDTLFVCEGDTYDLIADSVNEGEVFKWELGVGSSWGDDNENMLGIDNPAGIYTYTLAYKSDNCENWTRVQKKVHVVSNNNIDIELDLGLDTTICLGEEISLIASSANDDFTYFWTVDGQESVGTNEFNVTLFDTALINVRAIYTMCGDSIGSGVSDEILINVLTDDYEIPIDDEYNICNGDEIDIEPESIIAGFNYTWYSGNDVEHGYELNITGVDTVNYNIQMHKEGCNLNLNKEIQVNVNTVGLQSPIDNMNFSNTCPNQINYIGPDEDQDGLNYLWIIDADTILGTPLELDNVSSFIVYNFIVEREQCLTSLEYQYWLSPSYPPSSLNLINGDSLCQGDSVELGPENEIENFNYVWHIYTNGDTLYEYGTPKTFNPTENTDYRLVISNIDCPYLVDSTITVNVIENIGSLSINYPDTLCHGSQFSLTANIEENYTFEWGNDELGYTNTGDVSEYELSITEPTTIYLTATNSTCGATIEESISLELIDAPFEISDLSESFCYDEEIDIDPGIGNSSYNYVWTDENDIIISENENLSGLNAIESVQYTLMVNGACGLMAEEIVDITVHNEQTSVDLGEDLEICLGETTILNDIDPTNNYTYEWFIGEVNSDPIHFENSYEITADEPTEYTLVVSGENCTDVGIGDNTIFVDVIYESINFEIEDLYTVCFGDQLIIGESVAEPGFTYTWFDYDENIISEESFLDVDTYTGEGIYRIIINGPECDAIVDEYVEVQIEQNSCDCGINYHTLVRYVPGEQTWNAEYPVPNLSIAPEGVYRIKDHLIIQSGGVLTLSPGFILEMGPNAMITVEEGAVFNINGATITNICDSPWQGIEVFGDDDLPQQANNQGKVILQNDALIYGANVGVSLSGHEADGDYDWGTQGGILYARNSKFINCKKAIEFMSYQNTNASGQQIANVSYVKNCEFLFDQGVNDLHSGSELTGISLYKVDGVRILGCDFTLDLPVEASPYSLHHGAAIVSIDASYTFGANTIGLMYPPSYDRNYVSGFEYGVYVNNSDALSSVQVDRSDFHNNRVGVYLGNSDYSTVLRSSFEIPTMRDDIKILSAGLYLNESNHYQVEENTFEGISPLRNTASGIIVRNSGNSYNQLYRNDISRLDFGIGVYGVNATNPFVSFLNPIKYSGLHIDCNDFGEYSSVASSGDNNRNDIYLYDDAFIDETQGSGNAPAGNRFSDNPINGNDGCFSINNSYYNASEGTELLYYHNTEIYTRPFPFTSGRLEDVNTNIPYVEENTCPPNISNGPIHFDPDIKDLRDGELHERDLLVDNYKSILNGGIKPEIMAVLLDDFASTSEVHAKLAQGSPYLTDDVLIAAITREIPLNQWDLAQILIVNGRLSRKVLQVFNQTQPLTPFLANLVLSVEGSSLRYLLEMGIESKNIEVANLERQYVQTALFDSSIVTPYDQIADIYETPENIQQLRTKVSALLTQSEYASAQIVLDDYLADYSDNPLTLLQMQIDLATAGQGWKNLNNQQMTTLEQIASNTESIEQSKAISVLDFINDRPLPEFEMPVTYAPEARLTQQQTYTVLPRDLMSISPNPSDGEVYVTYELPREYSQAQLVMHNTLGQQVATWNITSHPQFFKLNCENYPTGVFSVSLMVDGKKIETQKLTLMTD